MGSYTNNIPDTGIYVLLFDEETGSLQVTSKVGNIINPSFLTVTEKGKILFACSDVSDSLNAEVHAFAFDANAGELTRVNSVSSRGENPVYVSLPTEEQHVAVANYTSGSAAVLRLSSTGAFTDTASSMRFFGTGPNTNRQEKSHIHGAFFSPDNRFLLLPDLGADRIWVLQYRPNEIPALVHDSAQDITNVPGSGPRHLVFHPKGNWLYVVEELSGTVAVFSFVNGQATPVQRVFAYSKQQEVYNSGDIHFSPDGKFLYVSNRWDKENTLAIFAVDSQTGHAALVGHQSTLGEHPRNFAISPSGKFLLVANMHSNEIVVFERNLETGLLRDTGKRYAVANPSCLQFKVM